MRSASSGASSQAASQDCPIVLIASSTRNLRATTMAKARCSPVRLRGRNAQAVSRHEGNDLPPYQWLHHYPLRSCQASFHAAQDPILLTEEGDGNHRAETRFAFQVLEYLEAIHLRQVHAEKEQVGGSTAREKAQSSERLIETDDLVPLAPQDHLEDLARRRGGVQHHDLQ